MKIDELNQKPALSYVVGGRSDKAETPDAQSDAAGKSQAAGDKVELSSYMPVVPSSKNPQTMRTNRIEELKSQIASGSYQVPAVSIAEKMIAKFATGTPN